MFFPKTCVTSFLDTLECWFVVFQVRLPSSGQASSIVLRGLLLENRIIWLLGWDQSQWNLLRDSLWCQGALDLTLHLCQALVSSPEWVICITLYSFPSILSHSMIWEDCARVCGSGRYLTCISLWWQKPLVTHFHPHVLPLRVVL